MNKDKTNFLKYWYFWSWLCKIYYFIKKKIDTYGFDKKFKLKKIKKKISYLSDLSNKDLNFIKSKI